MWVDVGAAGVGAVVVGVNSLLPPPSHPHPPFLNFLKGDPKCVYIYATIIIS